MLSTTTSAPSAHAFDPASWMENFKHVGGAYVLVDSRLHLMIQVRGVTYADQAAARQMIDNLTKAEHDTLAAALRQREAPKPIGAITFTSVADAWTQHNAAHIAMRALDALADDAPLWAIIDAAEAYIAENATSDRADIETLLKIALLHTMDERDDELAIVSGDFAAMDERNDGFDFNARAVFLALRKLQAMEA